MNDSIFISKRKKYLEQIREDIDDAEKVLSTSGDKINFKSFDLHDSLNKTFWDKDQNLRKDIREQLMQIAHDFYNTLDISEIVTGEENKSKKDDSTFDTYIKDILFVGSLASFNYSSYADVDLHLLMDEKELTDDNELALNILKKYFTECKNDWNLHHANLKVEGFDCELYVQDVKEENAANGVYSLFNDEWVKRPEPMDSQKFDKEWVEKKALSYIEQIDNIEDIINSGSDLDSVKNAKDDLDKIKDKIVQGRRDSLAAGQGEMNKYNILFKILRRSGHIEKINNLKVAAYDLLNSIDTNNKDLTKESCDIMAKENKDSEKSVVKESTDPIAEFADMYGEEAAEALEKYLIKRPNKSAEEVLASDDEFEKFGNWAYKHLKVDVYSNFSKYDIGDFNKRTSSLLKNPEGDDDGISIDDRTYDIMDGDDDNYDSPYEESINEDNMSIEQKVRSVLMGDFIDDEDGYGYTGKLVNSEDIGPATRIITKAIKAYKNGKLDAGKLEGQIVKILIQCGNDFPEYIENEAVMKLLEIADTQQLHEDDDGTTSIDDAENKDLKPKIIIGSEDENTTVVITPVEPEADANALLSEISKASKEKDSKNAPAKWDKDPEYSYWYFVAPLPAADVQAKVNQFKDKFDIEIQESKKADESKAVVKESIEPSDKLAQIQGVFHKYFETDANGNKNTEYDANFSAQDALDAITNIVGWN